MYDFDPQDTIAAIATPAGQGAIGMIRISGDQAIPYANAVFSKDILEAKGYTLHFGKVLKDAEVLDEVLLTVFRGPRSFTREDSVEITFHGSPYILREALQLLVDAGCRLARPGEFTKRAYLNGAMDLAQAEAVADLIASSSQAAHRLAMGQMRGEVSNELKELRGQLLDFTSLIELELDFGEEDVEFADRDQFLALIDKMEARLSRLIQSFQLGNALKRGVPTAIIGKPNAGKSTLLNALLQENRAIVSDIAGTTRDVVEDRLILNGIEFRLQDTAGIRETTDVIEKEGVSRSLGLAKQASIVLYIFDLSQTSVLEAREEVKALDLPEGCQVLLVANKVDLFARLTTQDDPQFVYISAKEGQSLDQLRSKMAAAVEQFHHSGENSDAVIISNIRHVDALRRTLDALHEVRQGMEAGLPSDLLTIDIRTALHHLGGITGEISTDEVLGNIFGKFCIGK